MTAPPCQTPFDPTGLMLTHAHALLGTFVTSVAQAGPGWWQIRSDTFPDEADWNVDVSESRRTPPTARRMWIAEPAGGPLALRHRLQRRRRRDGHLEGTEHWLMLALTNAQGHRAEPVAAAGDVRIRRFDRPTEAFCDVFSAAFELTPDEDHHYRQALTGSRPPPDVTTTHVLVEADNTPASIASLHCTSSTSFLYNIGTRPDLRGRGLARHAINETLDIACAIAPTIWLQCEPDSAAEHLYHSLGFHTIFNASFIGVS